jgi:hypothetical protein
MIVVTGKPRQAVLSGMLRANISHGRAQPRARLHVERLAGFEKRSKGSVWREWAQSSRFNGIGDLSVVARSSTNGV